MQRSSQQFVIERLSPRDHRWLKLVSEHPDAMIYHHPEWSSLLASSYGYKPTLAVVREAGGLIAAALPVMRVNTLFRRWRDISLPFTDYCPPLCLQAGGTQRLTRALIDAHEQHPSHSIEVRAPLPSCGRLRYASRHVMHQLELHPDPEQVTRRFSRMHRRNNRRASQSGLTLETGSTPSHIEEFYGLHLLTRRRQGMPVQPWHFFLALGRLLDSGLGFVMLTRLDGKSVAGAVFLHWNKTLTYKYGASVRESRALRPNNRIFSAAIEWGCRNGYRWFDMGRSETSNAGLIAFKQGWGARATPLRYSVITDAPSRRRSLTVSRYSRAVIRASPAWVCRATGELLYRHAA